MSPSAHDKKVTDEATKKKSESPFRCDNCGATFVSESERQTHQQEHQSPSRKSGK
jgi:hypothetical protein